MTEIHRFVILVLGSDVIDNTINLKNMNGTIMGKVNISIDFKFDSATQSLTFGTAITTIDTLDNMPSRIEVQRILTRTEKVYYLLLLGSGEISNYLLPNSNVSISYNNNIYKGVMHSQTKGRIAKLQQLYTQNKELLEDDVEIRASYDLKKNILYLEKIK